MWRLRKYNLCSFNWGTSSVKRYKILLKRLRKYLEPENVIGRCTFCGDDDINLYLPKKYSSWLNLNFYTNDNGCWLKVYFLYHRDHIVLLEEKLDLRKLKTTYLNILRLIDNAFNHPYRLGLYSISLFLYNWLNDNLDKSTYKFKGDSCYISLGKTEILLELNYNKSDSSVIDIKLYNGSQQNPERIITLSVAMITEEEIIDTIDKLLINYDL